MSKNNPSGQVAKGVLLAWLAVLFVVVLSYAHSVLYSPPTTHRVDLNFNVDWKYSQTDVSGADTAAYDDTEWIYVDLPHSTKFVTVEDSNAYQGVSWYRKHFSVAGEYRRRKVYIEFEAAARLGRSL